MILNKKSIQDLNIHDHTCLIFNNQLEFFHCAVPFIRDGIRKNEKCYIVIDEITKEDVLRNIKNVFREGIIPPHELTNEKHIVIEKFENIYLNGGTFSMERILQTYLGIINKALADGYSSLRVFAEVSTFLQDSINKDKFLIWEKIADKAFPVNKFIAVCAYNKKYISNGDLSHIKKVHPIEIDLLKTRL